MKDHGKCVHFELDEEKTASLDFYIDRGMTNISNTSTQWCMTHLSPESCPLDIFAYGQPRYLS